MLAATINPSLTPDKMRAYIVSGAPMGTLWRDASAFSNQIPRWAWMGVGGVALLLAYQASQVRALAR